MTNAVFATGAHGTSGNMLESTFVCPGSVTLVRHLPTSEPSALLLDLAKIILKTRQQRDTGADGNGKGTFPWRGGKVYKEWILLSPEFIGESSLLTHYT